jgi:hypothetical protein
MHLSLASREFGMPVSEWADDRHRDAVSPSPEGRSAKNLDKIAAIYSLEKLSEERGVGAATAAEIQLWLGERGASLRLSD